MKPYFEDDLTTLYLGDCRDILPSLLPVGCIITDPPFYMPATYHAAKGRWPRSLGDLVMFDNFYRSLFPILRKALTSEGHLYIHCDAISYPIFFACTFSLWDSSHLIVWYKPTGRRGLGWLHAHELILHCGMEQTSYVDGFRQDVIGIMPVRTLQRKHPAEKPGNLTAFLLEAVPKNFVVCDPFAGSGGTLLAAKAEGRKAIGIEIEERYCEIAMNRLAQYRLERTGVGML